MQRVTRPARHPRLSETAVGIIAFAVIAVLVGIVAYFYIAPPDERTVTFTTRDASSLRGGEDVRVAGVSVGTVKSLHLDADRVAVELAVKSSLRLGDQTRVDVRLLTAVGGYFVTLVPLGRPYSGNSGPVAIPEDRVTVPYTIADTIQALPRITDNVSGVPIDKILDQIDQGMGANPNALKGIVTGMHSLATIIDQQKQQVTSTLNLVSEYSATLNQSRDYIFELLRKINIVLSTYYTYRAGFSEAFVQLGGVLLRAGALAKFYVNHESDLARLVGLARDGAQQLRDGMDSLINNLAPLQSRLRGLAESGHSTNGDDSIDGAAICLPVAGRTC